MQNDSIDREEMMVKLEGTSNIIDNSEERQLIKVITDQLSKSKK